MSSDLFRKTFTILTSSDVQICSVIVEHLHTIVRRETEPNLAFVYSYCTPFKEKENPPHERLPHVNLYLSSAICQSNTDDIWRPGHQH